PPDHLERDVLEGERGAPVELEQVEVPELGDRADLGVVEGGVGVRDHGGELVPDEGALDEGEHHVGGDVCVGAGLGPHGRVEGGPAVGHVEAAVVGEPGEQDVAEVEGGGATAGGDVPHVSSLTTRSTEPIRSTASSASRSRRVARTSASRARWVMKIRRASSPRPSCSIERIDTPWSPNTPATWARTPGRSTTSRLR